MRQATPLTTGTCSTGASPPSSSDREQTQTRISHCTFVRVCVCSPGDRSIEVCFRAGDVESIDAYVHDYVDVAHNLCTPDNPMSDAQLETKFTGLAATVLGIADAKHAAETWWRLLELPDVRVLAELTNR